MRQVVGLVELVAGVFLLARATLIGQGDAGALGQEVHRLDKADVVDFLEKLEDVAADAAAEAVIDLAIDVDAERRGVLIVEGAGTEEIGAAALGELDVLGDDLDDVGRLFYALDDLFGDARHW